MVENASYQLTVEFVGVFVCVRAISFARQYPDAMRHAMHIVGGCVLVGKHRHSFTLDEMFAKLVLRAPHQR